MNADWKISGGQQLSSFSPPPRCDRRSNDWRAIPLAVRLRQAPLVDLALGVTTVASPRLEPNPSTRRRATRDLPSPPFPVGADRSGVTLDEHDERSRDGEPVRRTRHEEEEEEQGALTIPSHPEASPRGDASARAVPRRPRALSNRAGSSLEKYERSRLPQSHPESPPSPSPRPFPAPEDKKDKKKDKKEKEARENLLDEKLWEAAAAGRNVSSWADCDTDEDDDFGAAGGLGELPEDWADKAEKEDDVEEESDDESEDESDHEEDDDMVRTTTTRTRTRSPSPSPSPPLPRPRRLSSPRSSCRRRS